MIHTETVRYVLKDFKFREVSKGKGAVEYHLVDEHGNRRMVSAMAKLNWRNQVSSVRPIHNRELPLIEALAKAPLNETIEVDFSEFNKQYPRGSMRAKKMAVRNIKVVNRDLDGITSIHTIFDNKLRLMQLLLVSFLGFYAVVLIASKFDL